MDAGEMIAGRYRVERELGRGGMGAVYLAVDTRSSKQRRVAVKVAAAAGISHDQFLARFEREANIGCALGQEAGFVRAFDWGELDKTTVYMAMDLVEGAKSLDLRTGSLDDRLSRLEEAAVLVERAHELGVLHRDLKPANVLVARDGKAWLADFGLAKMRGESGGQAESPALTQTGHGMGTPQYMPPEQFEDAKNADERADVYALGVMLFQVLTGKYPFDGHSAAEILSRQMRAQMGSERPPRPRDLDPSVRVGLDSLCAEATALDRTKRTQSVSIFLRELRRARGKLGKPSARVAAAVPAAVAAAPAASEGLEPSLPSIRTLPDLGPGSGAPRTLPDLGPASAPASAPEGPIIRGGRRDSILADVLGNAAGRIAAGAGLIVVMILLRFVAFAATRPPMPVHPDPRSYEPGYDPRYEGRALDERALDGPATTGRGYPGESVETTAVRLHAERGDSAAMLNLAIRLERGTGVDANMSEAVRWYRRAASDDNADAMVCLGDLCLEGRGVAKDEGEARGWFQRAKSRGNTDGELRLEAMDAERDAERGARRPSSRRR